MMPFYWAFLSFFHDTLNFWEEPWKSHLDNICSWKMILQGRSSHPEMFRIQKQKPQGVTCSRLVLFSKLHVHPYLQPY